MPTFPAPRLSLAVLLAACPGSGDVADDTNTSTAADSTTTSTSGTAPTSTGDPPTSTEPPTTTTDDPTTTAPTTTDDPTTGPSPVGGDARIFFSVDSDTNNLARALRFVDIVDGAAAPAQTVLTAPDGETFRHTFDLSPTRRWIAVDATDTGRLWVVDTAAGAAAEIVGPPAVANVGAAVFSSDETLLTFTAAPMDGPSRRYVCAPQPGGACTPEDVGPPMGDMRNGPGVFSPDNTRLVHGGDLDGDDGLDVLLSDLANPGTVDVLAAYPEGWANFGLDAIRFTPDGEVLYYGIRQDTALSEHFAVDLSVSPPGPPVSLYPPQADDTRGYYAPDLHALLLWTRWDLDHGDLQRVEIDGLTGDGPVLVNTLGPHGVDENDLLWTADSQHILWLDDHMNPGDFEAYAATADGGAPVKLNAPISPGGDVHDLYPTPDPGAVLYMAEASVDSGYGLYWVRLDAPGEAVLLSSEGEVGNVYGWSPDGTRMLFSQGGADDRGLYLAFIAADGPTAVVRIDAGAPLHEDIMQFFVHPAFSPDGQRVFWRTETGADERALATVLADETGPLGPPQVLSAPGDDVVVLESVALP